MSKEQLTITDTENYSDEETREARRLIARINRRLRPEATVRTARGERMIQQCGTWYLHNWQYNYIERYLPGLADLRTLAEEIGCTSGRAA